MSVHPSGWFRIGCPECPDWWREAPGLSLDAMFREQSEHRLAAHGVPLPAEHLVRVRKVGAEWVATCNHGTEGVWTIHRSTEHNARRSLAAHRRHEHRSNLDTQETR